MALTMQIFLRLIERSHPFLCPKDSMQFILVVIWQELWVVLQ